MGLTEILKKSTVILLIFSIIILSGCEVFEALYGTPSENEDTTPKIDIEEIIFKPDTTSDSEEVLVDIGDISTPTVIIVEESEAVSLKPKAEDPDNDELIFTYTSPLDENGEWQTNFGDSGEYTVTVTVSDGQETDSQDVLIIVNKKEEPPEIIGSDPTESIVVIDETESTTFSVTAKDKNEDILSYTWKLDGNVVSEEDDYTYESTYDDEGSHTIKVDVSDGATAVNKIWSVTVNNVNREPLLEPLEDITVEETEIATISIFATDADGDDLEFFIDDSRFEQVETNEFEWETDYESEGEYKVKASVSDGTDTVSQEITVIVENRNRGPKLIGFEQKD